MAAIPHRTKPGGRVAVGAEMACQSAAPDENGINAIDVTAELAAIAAADSGFIHVEAFELSPQQEKLVITTAGIVELGRNGRPEATSNSRAVQESRGQCQIVI